MTACISLFKLGRGIAILSLLALSAGCAEKGPILIEGIAYKAPEGVTAGKGSTVIAVSPFRDVRQTKSSVIGQRQIREYIANDLVVQGTAADIVSGAVHEALTVRGIQSKHSTDWDLAETSISAEGADILVGGEIKTLWIEVHSQPVNVKYKAVVQLRVSAADAKDKKILRTLNLSSSLEREDVVYSDYTVQEILAAALSSAIDQLLNDEEFKKNIH